MELMACLGHRVLKGQRFENYYAKIFNSYIFCIFFSSSQHCFLYMWDQGMPGPEGKRGIDGSPSKVSLNH